MTVTVGEHSYCENGIQTYWPGGADLIIGKYCSIAPLVMVFLGGDHRTDWISTFPFVPSQPGHPATKGDVIIGNDVWVGFGVTIMSGVKIGDGSVVAAYSMVTKDVEPYSLVAGNPAEFKKYRFPLAERESLLEMAWWHWSEAKVAQAAPLLQSGDVAGLVAFHEKEVAWC